MAAESDIEAIDAERRRARALEAAGDLPGALAALDGALKAAPNDGELTADLAQLAGRMGMHEVALTLWRRLSDLEPDRMQAVDGMARALRDLHRYEDAVAVLQAVIPQHPGDSRLWNTLGTVLNQQGDTAAALTFFEEAVRTDGASAVARYNHGGVLFDLSRLDEAKADFAAARALADKPADVAMIDFAAAILKLARGELGAGWDAYEARFAPAFADAVAFDAPGEAWTPDTPLEGRRLLLIGEQGLGDEIMFANVIPDVLAAVGETGSLSLAVEPRLVPLFRRSFPAAKVTARRTEGAGSLPRLSAPDAEGIELWAPLGSVLRRFRRRLEAFPQTGGYLIPDPARIAHWRAWLGEGPAAGLSWRSGKLGGERRRAFPPIEAFAELVRTPGLRLVTLQYDVTPQELDQLSALAGRPLLEPPGLDLKNDLDDLAALCVALDAMVSVPNATAALAAASGAAIGILGGPASWSRLGTDGYPWYPQALGFPAPAIGAWDGPMVAATAFLEKIARRAGR